MVPAHAAALESAREAEELDEVPVGAVLLSAEGVVLAQAHNAPVTLSDPTAHAEIRVLREAAQAVGNYRLTGSILAVTLEPCLMCVGALIHARVAGVVFGARDPKSGAVVSRLDGLDIDFLNHRPWHVPDVLGEECGALLTDFFQRRRAEQKAGG